MKKEENIVQGSLTPEQQKYLLDEAIKKMVDGNNIIDSEDVTTIMNCCGVKIQHRDLCKIIEIALPESILQKSTYKVNVVKDCKGQEIFFEYRLKVFRVKTFLEKEFGLGQAVEEAINAYRNRTLINEIV